MQQEKLYLLGSLILAHAILEVHEPWPVEEQRGHREDEVEGQVRPGLVLGAVHQHQVWSKEAQTEHNVHISETENVR